MPSRLGLVPPDHYGFPPREWPIMPTRWKSILPPKMASPRVQGLEVVNGAHDQVGSALDVLDGIVGAAVGLIATDRHAMTPSWQAGAGSSRTLWFGISIHPGGNERSWGCLLLTVVRDACGGSVGHEHDGTSPQPGPAAVEGLALAVVFRRIVDAPSSPTA
jgi:hypothetical protein